MGKEYYFNNFVEWEVIFYQNRTKGDGDAGKHFGILLRKRMEDDER